MTAMSAPVLVTGGAGYIGAHACVELLQARHDVIVFDNLSNSHRSVTERIGRIAGRQPLFVEGDIRDSAALERAFSGHAVGAVLHFAGLKSIGESIERPLEYYDNNVRGSLVLLDTMARHGVRTLVFSSSAAVYGVTAALPIREDFPLQAADPYGRSKIMVEDMLRDLCRADPRWRIALLRYFNPVGAHESGMLGEHAGAVPDNLMSRISQVAEGRLEALPVLGGDYPTPDGTGVRDYIHVADLARAHLAALRHLGGASGVLTLNLGTGAGHSVLDMVRSFEQACGRKIPCRIVGRRAGDSAASYTDPQLANRLLGWRAQLGLERMCRDAWRWRQWMLMHGPG